MLIWFLANFQRCNESHKIYFDELNYHVMELNWMLRFYWTVLWLVGAITERSWYRKMRRKSRKSMCCRWSFWYSLLIMQRVGCENEIIKLYSIYPDWVWWNLSFPLVFNYVVIKNYLDRNQRFYACSARFHDICSLKLCLKRWWNNFQGFGHSN